MVRYTRDVRPASFDLGLSLAVMALLVLLNACQSPPPAKTANSVQAPPAVSESAQKPAAAPAPQSNAPVSAAAPAATSSQKAAPSGPFTAVHIKAGAGDSLTDSAGNVWVPDRGFAGGQTIARPEIEIANTKDPQIYRSERYLMDSFAQPVPNGNYVLKLHFAETFEGITGPGQRVFSFDAQGHVFADFDVWEKAGGPLRAYVETIPVTVTNGELKITFTPKVENPQINGIEILAAP